MGRGHGGNSRPAQRSAELPRKISCGSKFCSLGVFQARLLSQWRLSGGTFQLTPLIGHHVKDVCKKFEWSLNLWDIESIKT